MAYWKYDNIRFLLGSLHDHDSSMVQIITFLRADSPQLNQSEGKGSETGGLSNQCHRCLVPRCCGTTSICLSIGPCLGPRLLMRKHELESWCYDVLRSSPGSKNAHQSSRDSLIPFIFSVRGSAAFQFFGRATQSKRSHSRVVKSPSISGTTA